MRQKKLTVETNQVLNVLKIDEGAKIGTKIEFPFIQRN